MSQERAQRKVKNNPLVNAGISLFCAVLLPFFSKGLAQDIPSSEIPEGPAVFASASPTRVTVGDRILYSIAARAPEGMAVRWPPIGQAAGSFSVRYLGERPSEGGVETVSRVYELQIFETGLSFIPSQTVSFVDEEGETLELPTGQIAVDVVSVLDDQARDIRDIKPPLAIPYFSFSAAVWLIATGIAAALVILFLWRRKRRPAESGKPPPPPPHVIAFRELLEILAMDLVKKGRIKEYYTRISDVVRRYIERRFGLKAPDRTTEEFLEEARESGLLDPRARTLVGDFLEKCDMVKFARYGPTDEECEAAYRAARRFVDETRAVEEKP